MTQAVPFITALYTPFPKVDDTIKVAAFGRGENDLDWSLHGLESQHDLDHPNIVDVCERLEMICSATGVTQILSPTPANPNFNAHIGRLTDFSKKFEIGRCKQTNSSLVVQTPITLRKSAKFFDGVMIPPGFAGLQASADCWTAIVINAASGKMAMAHCGLKSLYDQGLVGAPKTRSREHQSVIEAVLDILCGPMTQGRAEVHVFIAVGIGPDHYEHHVSNKLYGQHNQAMIKHFSELSSDAVLDHTRGTFNIPEIITAQLKCLGVPRKQISVSCLPGSDKIVDTYSDLDRAGYPMWHSHRFSQTHARNAVLVFRQK